MSISYADQRGFEGAAPRHLSTLNFASIKWLNQFFEALVLQSGRSVSQLSPFLRNKLLR
jgi:hypothetical protein